jgi:hypothetical protein
MHYERLYGLDMRLPENLRIFLKITDMHIKPSISYTGKVTVKFAGKNLKVCIDI